MKTYWDYTEKERADFTSNQIDDLLKFELMHKGVLKPEQPVLHEVEEIEVDKQTYFQVKFGYRALDAVFETAEKAEEFLRLNPFNCDYDYKIGDGYRYAITPEDVSINPVQLCRYRDIALIKSKLEAIAAAKEANRKATDKYNEDLKITTEACAGVWDDWHLCREKQQQFQQVINTFAEYQKLSDGNDAVARSFLVKAFPEATVCAAAEWFDAPYLLPNQPVAVAAEDL